MKTIKDFLFHVRGCLSGFLLPITENQNFFCTFFCLLYIPEFVIRLHDLYLGVIQDTVSLKLILLVFHPRILACCIVYSFIFCLLPFLVRKWQKAVKIYSLVTVGGLALLVITDLSLFFMFHLRISPTAVNLLLQTDLQESYEFIATYLFSFQVVLVTVAVASFTIFGMHVRKRKYGMPVLTALFVVLVCAPLLCWRNFMALGRMLVASDSESLQNQMPYMSDDLFSRCVYSIRLASMSGQEVDFLRDQCTRVSAEFAGEDSPDIVFILGESFNRHHSNLYGYYLNTNPRLTKRYDEGELFVFSDVVAPYNFTQAVVQDILSVNSAEPDMFWHNSPLFPSVFKKAGYYSVFISNQLINSVEQSRWEYAIAAALNDKVVEENNFDLRNDSLYKYDIEIVERWKGNYSKYMKENNLVIFHLMGQHFDAKIRFPHTSENVCFTQDSINRPDLKVAQRQKIADYDNATVYNDKVVDEIIKTFENRDAVLVYVSDHGEEVNDYRIKVGRSYESPLQMEQVRQQFEVPMFVWCSRSFREKRPKLVRQIKESVDRPFRNDDIPHLLFDLADLKTPFFDESRSPINRCYKIRPRHLLRSETEIYENIVGR